MSQPQDPNLFDAWITQAPLEQLEREMAEYERRFTVKDQELQALAIEARQLHVEVERRRRAIEFLREVGASSQSGTSEVEDGEGPGASAPTTKPDMIIAILSEAGSPMRPRDVAQEAARRGWIPDNSSSRNQITVSMNKLKHAMRLLQVADGRYALPPRMGAHVLHPNAATFGAQGDDEN